MSRVGKLPVAVPAGVKVALADGALTVTGPKGTLTKSFHPGVTVTVDSAAVTVTRSSDSPYFRALHGMTRAIINNMVIGVTAGYTRELELVGVGYRGEMKGKHLMLYVGYSHPVLVRAPEGVKLAFEPKGGLITVTGIDKEMVGQTADRIRAIRKPEPYKGKGIKYKDEHIRRKAGKTAA